MSFLTTQPEELDAGDRRRAREAMKTALQLEGRARPGAR